MEQSRRWRSFGWEGALLLLGALAIGAFGLVGSCDADKTAGLHSGSIGGAGGLSGPGAAPGHPLK